VVAGTDRPWLSGYEKSSPVRIGNAAYQRLQIDVFGEVADVMFQALRAGMEPSERGRALQPFVLEYLATAWREPDEGIWEVRGGRQHFVHSKVMAWVAFDHAANAVSAASADRCEVLRKLPELITRTEHDKENPAFQPGFLFFANAGARNAGSRHLARAFPT